MEIGGKLFAYACILYFGIAAVYGFMSHDPIGTTAIAMSGGLAFLIAFYALFTSKRVGDLPEDNENARIEDADTDYGFFSPHSIWPLALGFSAFMFIMGFVFANWLAVLGLIALLFSVFGLIFEYYRGDFAS